MNKKLVSLVIVALLLTAIFFATPTQALSERMSYLTEQKIVIGDENGNLNLKDPIDRASLSKVLVYALGQQEKAETLKNVPSVFSDMVAGGWANGYVNVVATEGIVNGYPDGRFGPQDNVTFEQAIKMFTIAALGHDVEGAETAKGQGWATPYIQKASELGLLKHMNTTDYKTIAPREDIFDILYEVLMYKENQQTLSYRGMVMEMSEKDKARVLIIRGEEEPYKPEDIVEFTFATEDNAEDYLGRVIDFKVGDDKILRNPVIAKEYEVLSGGFTIGKDDLLYMNGSKRGLVVEENKESRLNDALVNIVHNDESYSLQKYRDEIKDEASYGFVTVHNSKVVFIRTYTFKDIVPVSKVAGDTIYVLRDSNPKAEARQNVVKVLEDTRDGLKVIDRSRLGIDDVLHIYKDGFVILNRDKRNDARFKVEEKDGVTVLTIDSVSYPLNDEEGFRAIINVNFQEYDTVYPKKNIQTLKSMEGNKSVLLIDLFGNVQLIRGDLQEKEELMIVTGVTANRIRLQDMDNRQLEVADNYGIDIYENGKVIRMMDLAKGDLVYVFTRDGETRGITVVKRATNIEDSMELVKVENGKLAIDLAPSRGRFALLNTEVANYELTEKTNVIVQKNGDFFFTTIAEVAKKANPAKGLEASVVTGKDFVDAKTGSKIPQSDRSDLLHTVVFKNYEETTDIADTATIQLINGFNPKIDKTMVGNDTNKEKVEYSIFKNARLGEYEPGDILRLELDKDGAVVKAEVLITKDARTYEILSILEKDGVIRLEIKRTDTNEEFTKYLAKYAAVFGELKEGAIMRMYVVKDDIAAMEIVK
ncbi:MAG: S-layer homology domain-containing protein [Tissierellia bacterium]|nr:S-layer homology domain-containing protein [Tissierellia bacterium]